VGGDFDGADEMDLADDVDSLQLLLETAMPIDNCCLGYVTKSQAVGSIPQMDLQVLSV
jgi:hypothetical protein